MYVLRHYRDLNADTSVVARPNIVASAVDLHVPRTNLGRGGAILAGNNLAGVSAGNCVRRKKSELVSSHM